MWDGVVAEQGVVVAGRIGRMARSVRAWDGKEKQRKTHEIV